MLWTLAATIVGVLGALVLVRSLLSAKALRTTTYEVSLANSAAQAMAQELLAQDFADVFERYNAITSDDPTGRTSPGSGFAVPGLDAVASDADGLCGEIQFPVSSGAAGQINETLTSFPGMPRDLNVDGDASDTNVTADHAFLPVRIAVTWQGSNGVSTVEVVTTLGPGL